MITSGVTAVLVDATGSGVPVASTIPGVVILARAAGATAAARLAGSRRPHLVIVDLDRALGAISAIDAVVTAAPGVPVLALAGDPDPATVLAAVRAGASSVLRGRDPDELAAGVRGTVAGAAVFSPGLAALALARAGESADPPPAARRLTEREADVVRLLVDGLTARQTAGRLGLSPRTVENHVQHVLRKLGLHSRAALVRYAIEHGLG